MAIFYNNFRNNSKNILFFAHLFVPLHTIFENQAQMAESVDALVSNTSGATHPGSSPGLGTRNPLRTDVCRGFFLSRREVIARG